MVISVIRYVSVATLVGKASLVGAVAGRKDSALFADEIFSKKEPVCFDWSNVELATGSYLKAAYLPHFRSAHGVPIFSVGINTTTRDELELALETESRPIFLVDRLKNGRARGLRLFGSLDAAYERTLATLATCKDASASELYQKTLNEFPQIGKTAWINRLTRLHEMGVIARFKVGKGFRYSTIEL